MNEQKPPKTFWQSFAKQIGIGVLCACLSGAIYRSADLVKVSRWIASIFIHTTGGDPLNNKPPILEKLPKIPVVSPGSIPVPVVGKTPEEREKERLRKEQKDRNELEARAEKAGVKFDKEWTLEKLKIEVEDKEQEQREQKQKVEENEKKRPLIARADKIKLAVDITLPYKELKQAVEHGEKEYEADCEYQAALRQYEEDYKLWEWAIKVGPNARCLNKACAHRWRTKLEKGQVFCPRCRAVWFVVQVKANAVPPPRPPRKPVRRQPGLIDQVKGTVKGIFGK